MHIPISYSDLVGGIMPSQKTVDCKIFSKEGHTLLAEGTIRLTRLKPQSKTGTPGSYKGQISFLNFLPDLESKSVILWINPDISGSVFMHAPSVQTSTRRLGGVMNVYFEDPIWTGSEWFDTL